MAKHSKWAKVKNYKGAADAKRSGVFTKHARAIAVAARNGADPASNFQLRMAIDAARADNVPNDNIDRAIAKGSGADAGEQMKEVLYEGFGPGGAALLIEAVTDNPNRTVQNLRNIVSKLGGNLSGSVQWQFERRGVLRLPKSAGSGDDFQLHLIDAGAADVEADDEGTTVFTAPGDVERVRTALVAKGWTPEAAETAWIPKEQMPLSGADAETFMKLWDQLNEDDDVQKVATNATWE